MSVTTHCWSIWRGPEDEAASGWGASSSEVLVLSSVGCWADGRWACAGDRSRRCMARSTSKYAVLFNCLGGRWRGGRYTGPCCCVAASAAGWCPTSVSGSQLWWCTSGGGCTSPSDCSESEAKERLPSDWEGGPPGAGSFGRGGCVGGWAVASCAATSGCRSGTCSGIAVVRCARTSWLGGGRP